MEIGGIRCAIPPYGLLLAAVLAVGGCVHEMRDWRDVKGRFPETGEIFVGSMTRYVLSGEGTFGFRTDRGRTCFGRFVPVHAPHGGAGTLACGPQVAGEVCRGCSPEPTEPFSFVLADGPDGLRGTGSGMIEGRRFTFTLLVFRMPDFWDGVPACLGPGTGGTERLRCPG